MRFHVCIIFAAFLGALPNDAKSTNSSASFLRGTSDFPGGLASAKRALNIFTDKRWKDRVGDVVQIPYTVDSTYFTRGDQQLIQSSIQALADLSKVVQFVQRSNQAAYINVVAHPNNGCRSHVGRTSTGKQQEINLVEGCLHLGTIQHEFLHALGFTHEHNRPDRDTFVTINLDNIDEKKWHNFDKDPASSVLGAPYDYGSVLHYGRDAFALDDNIGAVIPTDPNAVIGQRDGATEQDIVDIRLLYQCLSGPRTLSEYQDNLCTSDCKCWEGATGCNGNDDWCQGGMTCQDNQCVRNSGGGGNTGGGGGGGCTDVFGWVDIEGDGCDWYEEWDADVACTFGDSYGNAAGTTAKEACCVCGGGSLAGATFWTLKNLETPGMCLSASSTGDGNAIVHYECYETPSQRWWIDSNFYIRSALDINKCIVGAKGATESGTHLIINDCFANDDRFVFWYYTDGTFRPEKNENLCIGPSRSDVHSSLLTPLLELRECSGRSHQQWQLSKEEDVQGRAFEDCSDVPLGWYDAYGDNCAWYAEGSRCHYYGNANKNFGKTANQACCSCGGGSLLELVNEDDILLSDSVLSDDRCWDTPDWTDSVGDSCTWYEQGDNCRYYGDEFATAAGNANEACCACGGGSSSPPSDGNGVFDAPGCSNSPGGWIDSDGDDCYWYAEGENCGLYGNDYAGEEDKTASEACCACGGGSNPSIDPPTNELEECSDIIRWADSFGDGCQWYGIGARCALYGGANAGADGRTADQACCICGGGILASCDDLPSEWVDIGGDGCTWYENGDSCASYGYDPINAGPDGQTASEACCICGGGSHPSTHPSKNPTSGPSFEPSLGPSYEPSKFPSLVPSLSPSIVATLGGILASCDDLPSEWVDIGGNGCAWYENGDSCSSYGYDPTNAGPDGQTASEACCICGGGSHPSTHPSKNPTLGPFEPSLGPSYEPSEVPSVVPSLFPSIAATLEPTTRPSDSPTDSPTTIVSSERPPPTLEDEEDEDTWESGTVTLERPPPVLWDEEEEDLSSIPGDDVFVEDPIVEDPLPPLGFKEELLSSLASSGAMAMICNGLFLVFGMTFASALISM